MEYFIIFMILCLAPTGWSSRIDAKYSATNNLIDFGGDKASKIYNVLDFEAVGDGKTDDTQAFVKAWRAVCADNLNDSLLLIPSKEFLLKPVTFEGPCKSANVQVQVLGNIIAPLFPAWTPPSSSLWLQFSRVNGLNIYGNGLIDGNGREWWSSCGRNCQRPNALTFNECNGLQLSGLKFSNSQGNHISITGCNGATLSNLHITAPGNSPNTTDGINIEGSANVRINDSFIGTGGNCVGIYRDSFYINITNVQCGPGHGISVGGLGANGPYNFERVNDVHVKNCNFNRTQTGVSIKTWEGGAGYARKITFEQINFTAVQNPIIIDQIHCNSERMNCSDPVFAIKVSDVRYIGVRGSSENDNAINLGCSRILGCTNIFMEDVNIVSTAKGRKTYSSCINAHGASRQTYPPVPCLA